MTAPEPDRAGGEEQERPLVLYHGTRRGFTRGGVLLPRNEHRGTATTAPVSPDREVPTDAGAFVYLTEELDLAWAYAWCAPGRGRPKVLEVRPLGPIEPDYEHSALMRAWRCPAALVTRVLKEPTMTESEAREGWQTQ